MKTRITFVAENNTKIPEWVDRKLISEQGQYAWQFLLETLALATDGSKVVVEEVEVFDD